MRTFQKIAASAVFSTTLAITSNAFSIHRSSSSFHGGQREVTSSASSSARFLSDQMPEIKIKGDEGADLSDYGVYQMPYGEETMPFYALGMNLALQVASTNDLKALLSDAEFEVLVEGFIETIKGTSKANPDVVMRTFGPPLNQILQDRTLQMAQGFKQSGAAFMDRFLQEHQNAVKTNSGMIYCAEREGNGKQASIASTVEVHYHGTLTDGTVFDSSVERGETISFPLNQVIPGWQEGLALMKEGGKATLVIPSDMAYGDSGSGAIPPGSTLKFDVELFKVL